MLIKIQKSFNCIIRAEGEVDLGKNQKSKILCPCIFNLASPKVGNLQFHAHLPQAMRSLVPVLYIQRWAMILENVLI